MHWKRFEQNPLILPEHVPTLRPDFEVVSVLNPAATVCNGEVILLLRIAERPVEKEGYLSTLVFDTEAPEPGPRPRHYKLDDPLFSCTEPRIFVYDKQLMLTTLSTLRVARSQDGRTFTIDDAPLIAPRNPWESYGIEDARITQMGDVYWINATAVSDQGCCTTLYSTRDFRSYEDHGIIFCPDNKDVAIFPEKVGGHYVAMHRPASIFQLPSIWLAESDDLLHWGRHKLLISPRRGMWDAVRLGAGAPPIHTDAGWLELYHGVSEEGTYALGALLLDIDDPSKILARSDEALFKPEAAYETKGFFGNVVFSNGMVELDGRLLVYYGAADTIVAGAETTVAEVLGSLGF